MSEAGRRDLIASGCHDPSGTSNLLCSIRRPSVSCQSVDNPSSYKPPSSLLLFVHKPACVAAPLSSRPLRRSRTPHSRLHSHWPPTPLYTTLHYTTLHCTALYSTARLRKTPWVLRLATTSSSGRSRAFRQIIGANLLLENGAITCPLTSAPPPPYTSIAPPTPRFSPDTRFLTHCATTTDSTHRLDTLILCYLFV